MMWLIELYYEVLKHYQAIKAQLKAESETEYITPDFDRYLKGLEAGLPLLHEPYPSPVYKEGESLFQNEQILVVFWGGPEHKYMGMRMHTNDEHGIGFEFSPEGKLLNYLHDGKVVSSPKFKGDTESFSKVLGHFNKILDHHHAGKPQS